MCNYLVKSHLVSVGGVGDDMAMEIGVIADMIHKQKQRLAAVAGDACYRNPSPVRESVYRGVGGGGVYVGYSGDLSPLSPASPAQITIKRGSVRDDTK